MTMYAILSWDTENGPIKSWDRLTSVEIHNGRVKPIAHGVDGAPPPKFLVGTPEIRRDVRQRLAEHNVDPNNVSKDGVIAWEAYMSASREFFAAGTPAQQQARLEDWSTAQVEFMSKRYGPHRVVSMVLHQDEATPHIHAVVVPLKFHDDGRKRGTWSLNNEVLGGGRSWVRLQTDYGMAMAHLGLSRGEEGRDHKARPYAEVMAEVEAERNALRVKEQEMEARQREMDACMVELRDRWLAVQEEKREAESARSAAASLLKEAVERQAEYDATKARDDERLRADFELLRRQQAAADAREKEMDERERALIAREKRAAMPAGTLVEASRAAFSQGLGRTA